VPPKYKREDFLKTSYWNQRGKLDVPKERFVSYPMASPDSDDLPLLGWAGWDQLRARQVLDTVSWTRARLPGLDRTARALDWIVWDHLHSAFGRDPW